MIGAALWLTWWWLARKENIAPPPRRVAGRAVAAFRAAAWALMLPVIILVGLKLGVFTPTEAGVVAAVYALFVSTVIYRELKLRSCTASSSAPPSTTAVVMFLVAAAMVSAPG